MIKRVFIFCIFVFIVIITTLIIRSSNRITYYQYGVYSIQRDIQRDIVKADYFYINNLKFTPIKIKNCAYKCHPITAIVSIVNRSK